MGDYKLPSEAQEKQCKRCNSTFQCNAHAIESCQCYAVQLNEQERAFIAKAYDNCLCAACLLVLKEEVNGLQIDI